MLKILRQRKTMKRIMWALVILIVPPFVIWGSGVSSRAKRMAPSYVGKIYGKTITLKEFSESYEACYHQLLLSSGGDTELFKKMMDSANINRMAWDRLLLLAEAKRQQIKVTNKEIIDAIAYSPLFNKRGMFDNQIYNYILRNNLAVTPRQFEEEIRDSITIVKLRNKILPDISINDNELFEEYKKENEKIKISFILIDNENFIKDVQISEEGLKKFYEENKENFKKDDEVNIKYFHIEQSDSQLIDKISEEIKNKEDLEKIASKNNLEVKETNFFSMNEEIPAIGWSYDIVRIAFILKEGMTSSPIYTPKGYYVIKVKEKRSGHIPAFEKLRPALRKEFKKTNSFALAKESASKIYDEINAAIQKGESFENIAKKMNLKIEASEPFSRKEYIKELGQAKLVKEIAFAVPKGKISSAIQCEKGFVIIRADELMPVDVKTFESEKEKLKEKLLKTRRLDAFNNWFKEILEHAELKIDLDLLTR